MAWSTPPWVRRTFTLDPRSLAAFRIAIGSVVLADALLRGRDASLMLAPDGMFPLAALRDFFGDHWAWSLAFLVDATWWGVAVLVLEGVAGAGLAVGLCTRPATIAAWVAVVSIVRRTAPATNAGDEWLCCLLFWAMFLPLGAVWSVDAVRSRTAACAGVVSPAGIALVLQMAAVYLGAGLAKLNPTWLAGDAVARALSWHDHGTALGQAFSLHPLACRLLTWGVVALELAGPCLLVASGRPTLRGGLVAVFLAFHAAAAVLMSLGLFAYVGMAAWLAFIPGTWWGRAAGFDARAAAEAPLYRRLPAASAIAVVIAAGVAALSFLHENTHWRTRPLPRWLRAAVRATCLGQDWGMFGEVAPQRQWVYGRGTLTDGRVIDVLRRGHPIEETLPAGGFSTLPNHRWHKIFWELPQPERRIFSPSIAAALARDWNRRHGKAEQLTELEIRAARLGDDPAPDTRQEVLLASWPARDARGRGNLERMLGAEPASD